LNTSVAASGTLDDVSHPILLEARGKATLAECVAVIRAAFQTVADDFGFTETQVPTNAAFLTLDQLQTAQTRGDRILALRVDGRIVGSVSLRASTSRAVVELERLAVAPPFRHQGYGGVLVERSCAIAAADGATTISVGIIATNTLLRRWYERHGFAVTATRTFEHLPFTVWYLQRPATPEAT
jgi:ribosomal protein S18 acetylase RimI-like enzyme